jgi:hypothetical protein
MKSIWNLLFGKDEQPQRRMLGRFKVRDGGPVNPLAFLGRMPAGLEGDISSFPGCWVEPCQVSPNTAAALVPGMAVVLDGAVGVRSIVHTDQAVTAIYGFVVRVYPTQQVTGGMQAGLGNSAVQGPTVDILRRGAMMIQVNGTITVKGSQVHIWADIPAGAHRLGFCEAAATFGSTIDLPLTTGALQAATAYNGPGDTTGVTQVNFNL